MNNQKILEKAIQTAIDNGWKLPAIGGEDYTDEITVINQDWIKIADVQYGKESLIFNHDFAKALWGTEYKKWALSLDEETEETSIWCYAWQYHLARAVSAEDPIKYLGGTI